MVNSVQSVFSVYFMCLYDSTAVGSEVIYSPEEDKKKTSRNVEVDTGFALNVGCWTPHWKTFLDCDTCKWVCKLPSICMDKDKLN